MCIFPLSQPNFTLISNLFITIYAENMSSIRCLVCIEHNNWVKIFSHAQCSSSQTNFKEYFTVYKSQNMCTSTYLLDKGLYISSMRERMLLLLAIKCNVSWSSGSLTLKQLRLSLNLVSSIENFDGFHAHIGPKRLLLTHAVLQR